MFVGSRHLAALKKNSVTQPKLNEKNNWFISFFVITQLINGYFGLTLSRVVTIHAVLKRVQPTLLEKKAVHS